MTSEPKISHGVFFVLEATLREEFGWELENFSTAESIFKGPNDRSVVLSNQGWSLFVAGKQVKTGRFSQELRTALKAAND